MCPCQETPLHVFFHLAKHGERLRWYASCKPGPFSPDLARRMRGSGCEGVNFGVDSGDEGMLDRLGRDFSPEEILSAARLRRENGIAVMFDPCWAHRGKPARASPGQSN